MSVNQLKKQNRHARHQRDINAKAHARSMAARSYGAMNESEDRSEHATRRHERMPGQVLMDLFGHDGSYRNKAERERAAEARRAIAAAEIEVIKAVDAKAMAIKEVEPAEKEQPTKSQRFRDKLKQIFSWKKEKPK